MNVASVLSPREVALLGGMPHEAVVGVYADAACTLDSFHPNPDFLRFLHRVIDKAGLTDPGLQAAARAQGSGWIYIIDLRTPDGPQGRVPSEDIIGGFKVDQGRLVRGGYEPNETYRAMTASGTVKLPPYLRQGFFRAVKELVEARARAS